MLIRQISNFKLEAGCDEAGRGCLAGPVVAVPGSPAEPQQVGIVEPLKIDEINILNASFLAMHKALKKLKPQPKFIAIDGNRFNPYGKTPFECVIKGDGKVQNIAAASVLAKTYRDEIMQKLHLKHPEYGWDSNKGYPTQKHREAIKKIGTTPFHRMSFTLLPNQLKLQL